MPVPNTDSFILQRLTDTVTHIHQLGQHFAQIKYLSKADIAQLKAIIDQLEYLLNSLQLDHRLVKYLQDATAHLKKILQENEHSAFEHSHAQQQLNNKLSLQLLQRIKRLSHQSTAG